MLLGWILIIRLAVGVVDLQVGIRVPNFHVLGQMAGQVAAPVVLVPDPQHLAAQERPVLVTMAAQRRDHLVSPVVAVVAQAQLALTQPAPTGVMAAMAQQHHWTMFRQLVQVVVAAVRRPIQPEQAEQAAAVQDQIAAQPVLTALQIRAAAAVAAV